MILNFNANVTQIIKDLFLLPSFRSSRKQQQCRSSAAVPQQRSSAAVPQTQQCRSSAGTEERSN